MIVRTPRAGKAAQKMKVRGFFIDQSAEAGTYPIRRHQTTPQTDRHRRPAESHA